MTLRKIVVFGGSGFIGRSVCAALREQGASVVVATRTPRGSDEVFYRRGDEASIGAALTGADAVVHLIGILAERRGEDFFSVQRDGPAEIAVIARRMGVADFVLMSAIGADAASPARYGRSKAAGEEAVRFAFPAAIILRPSIVVGPGDGFFGLFSRMARVSPVLPLIGGGTTRFQPVFVGDVAAAVAVSLASPEWRGRLFELGGPGVFSFRELLAMLLRAVRLRRLLMPLPWSIAGLEAMVLERLPGPLLTRDQLAMLRHDNVVAPGSEGFAALGIATTSVEQVLADLFPA